MLECSQSCGLPGSQIDKCVEHVENVSAEQEVTTVLTQKVVVGEDRVKQWD